MNWIIAILTAIAILILYAYLMDKKWREKLKRLNHSRPKLSEAEYIEKLVSKGYSRNEIEVAYYAIQHYIGNPDFSLYPDDDIYKTCEIDPEDYEDLIAEIFNMLGRPLPEQERIDALSIKYQKDMKVDYVLELLR